jgi:L-lactate dehydrogenase complex protein LldF
VQLTSQQFKQVAKQKLADPGLQDKFTRAMARMSGARAQAAAKVPNFEEIRTAGAAIRERVLKNLDAYLFQFEQTAQARGAVIHWAETGEDVNRIVREIAQANGVKKIIKSKSMLGEESSLNHYLQEAGLDVRETDLGEYILQISGETPSHIIAPAIHKSKEDVGELFERVHQMPRKKTIPEMCREARMMLRPHFLSADMGISGANFLIAETGSVMIVTNEGNGRMTTTLPRIHVAITGIEKVVPTLEDASVLLRLLTRSATGQAISNYISMLTGVRGPEDTDGPEQFHIVIVDSHRTKLLASEMNEALRCIRCGACMNHCPVYEAIGGHAYGWVYPGPIGSVLTPSYVGLENAADLPNASTLCGACAVVCPVKIPLPDLMRKLREKAFEQKLHPASERASMRAWGYFAARPKLYAFAAKLGARALKWMGGAAGRIRKLPTGGKGWTDGRDMPAPAGKTFRELYAERRGKRS